MHGMQLFLYKILLRVCLGNLFLTGAGFACDSALLKRFGADGSAAFAQTAPAIQPLSANDVSWLFPAPTKAEDFANLISMADLTAPNPQDPSKRDRVWSDATFAQFLGIAASPAAFGGRDAKPYWLAY